jgi:hypothetical protein
VRHSWHPAAGGPLDVWTHGAMQVEVRYAADTQVVNELYSSQMPAELLLTAAQLTEHSCATACADSGHTPITSLAGQRH